MNLITDVASSPIVAIPLGVGTAAANFITVLPILINVAMFIYFCILVAHKIWVWWREWKEIIPIKDIE